MKPNTLAAALILLFVTSLAPGANAPDAPHDLVPAGAHATAATSPPHHDHHPPYHHPTLAPPHTIWPGTMVLIVIGMFLAAAMIGVVVRLNMPEALGPENAHGHDEPGHHPHAHGHH